MRSWTHACLFVLAAASGRVLTACEEPSPPWAGKPDGRVVDESQPFLPSHRPDLIDGRTDTGHAGGGDAGSGDEPLPEEELLARPAGRHGGMWMSCHDRFVASGEPKRDVTRLALSCGPVTGMRRASGLITGTLDAETRGEHRFAGSAGHCYRVFAVGGEGIESLDVRVLDGAGEEIARHVATVPWAAVEPERPFCATEDTPLSVVVEARGGAGAFAFEVWTIPPRERGL